MKAVMYHYVRRGTADLPFFRYLHVENFRRQLDWLQAQGPILSRQEFEAAVDNKLSGEGFVLTFDDGLVDHAQWVLPELVRRGLWGLFFIPTGPFHTGKLLNVHRVHLLLGRRGGQMMLARLAALLRADDLVHEQVAAFHQPYVAQDNDEATSRFKRILNYFIGHSARERILDTLMEDEFGPEDALAERFYLNRAEIRALADAGMGIGSHGVSHSVFSTMDRDAQEAEIADSLAFLEAVAGPLRPHGFSYPYGGFHTFTAETEALLGARGYRFAFNVEPRDIDSKDLAGRPMALPRYDCNLFPHGAASLGMSTEYP